MEESDAVSAKRVFSAINPGAKRFRVESRMKRAKIMAGGVFGGASGSQARMREIAAQKAVVTGIRRSDLELNLRHKSAVPPTFSLSVSSPMRSTGADKA
jgi:hypothetical protein